MPKILALFDVDGTLTVPRSTITPSMQSFMDALPSRGVTVGIVGGSDLEKQREQLGEDACERYEFSFSQNGLVAWRGGKVGYASGARKTKQRDIGARSTHGPDQYF